MRAYHGTSAENAAAIKREGFRTGTYFAFDRCNAIHFGGPVVFEVEFSDDPSHWRGVADGWQFWLQEPMGPEHIISVHDEWGSYG